MLESLHIKNIALIDDAVIEFSNGLNVLSGETGSGKSVIIESLNFVLGGKADKTLIRSGTNDCQVTAIFNVDENEGLHNVFNEFEIEYDSTIIIDRKLSIDGKNNIKLNGNVITSTMLKKFTEYLVDVHGQSEHFNLLKNSNQLALIDKFAGEKLQSIKEKNKTLISEIKDINCQLEQLGGDEQNRLMRLDILNFQIKEISDANLIEGEEEKLKEIKDQLNNQEKISNALSCFIQSMQFENGISDGLSVSLKNLSAICSVNDKYQDIYDRVYNCFSELTDLSCDCEKLLDDFSDNDYDIEKIESRLDVIKSLKKKYGQDIKDIKLFLQNATDEKNKLENFNEVAEHLLKRKEELKDAIYQNYKSINKLRLNSSIEFKNNVLIELQSLGMPNSKFDIIFEEFPSIDKCNFENTNGVDKIEFMFSANKGEPLKDLKSVISGGEMSRFMLSIKAQTSKYKDVSTFIFDEIDAGISGNIAKVIAEKFAVISRHTQIIAISHLPQISSMADNNLLIFKVEDKEKTFTNVIKLDSQSKISEIVRLIGGNINNNTAISHAKDLISEAEKYKQTL